MTLSFVVIIFGITIPAISAPCTSVIMPSDPIVMDKEKLLARQNLKYNFDDDLDTIYSGIYASKKLLQINNCGDVFLLSLKDDVFQMLSSDSTIGSLKEAHSNVSSYIKKNNILQSIGLLSYSGHGLFKSFRSHTCTATLITPKHILTSAHCVIQHKFDTQRKQHIHALDLKRFKFFPAADKQFRDWIADIITKLGAGTGILQTIRWFFSVQRFINDKNIESIGIKNAFIPYLYMQDIHQEDWALIELTKPLFDIRTTKHDVGYSLMNFGFDAGFSEQLKTDKLIHFETAGYPGNTHCCKLHVKEFDVNVMNQNIMYDNVHKHYVGQSGSPIWKTDGLSHITYGILMGGHDVIGNNAWRITKDEYYTICDLIKRQYPSVC
eukprot:749178_1